MKYYAGPSEEYYVSGPHDSEEEAINDFKECHEDRQGICLGIETKLRPSFSSQAFFEDTLDDCDISPDYYDSFFSKVKRESFDELDKEINGLIEKWLDKVNPPTLIEFYKKV